MIQLDLCHTKMPMSFYYAIKSLIPSLYTISRINGFESYDLIGKICPLFFAAVKQICEQTLSHCHTSGKQEEHQ